MQGESATQGESMPQGESASQGESGVRVVARVRDEETVEGFDAQRAAVQEVQGHKKDEWQDRGERRGGT